MDNEEHSEKSIQWDDMDQTSYILYGSAYIFGLNTLLYPTELLRTRLQADDGPYRKIKIRTMFYNIWKKEGLRGSIPGQFIYYGTYEVANQKMNDAVPITNPVAKGLVCQGLAGLISEAACALMYVPSDIVSQKLQVQTRINFLSREYFCNGTWEVMKYIYRYEVLFVQFHHRTSGPGSAIWWSSYELCKSTITKSFSVIENSVRKQEGYQDFKIKGKSYINHFFSGAIAGVCSILVTNPLDVARTRLQLLDVRSKTDARRLHNGFFKIVRDVYRNEGIRGCYKGAKPRVYITIPTSAFAFVGYEILKEYSLKKKSEV